MIPGPCAAGAGAALLIGLATAPAVAGGTAAAVAEPVGCSANAHIDAQWGDGASGGQIVTVTVTNTGATTATKWSVSWVLASGQSLASAWNAAITKSDATVTAVNAAYNGLLAAAASTTFGMQLNGTGPVPALACANNATPQQGGAAVTLTEVDNSTTVTILIGQSVGISLGPDFRPTTVTGPALLRESTSGGYPTGLPLAELYRAHDVGSVDVSTTTDYACLHTTPRCALPVKLWRVHVNVVGG